jgi:hypothetical protein
MAAVNKPVQVKFHLDREKSAALEEYLKATGKSKQEVFEAFVDMIIVTTKK